MSDCDGAVDDGERGGRNGSPTGYTKGSQCKGFVLRSAAGEAERAARVALGSLVRTGEPGFAEVSLGLDLDTTMAAESYRLQTTPEGAHVIGGDYAGLVYGCLALRDLLPADAWRSCGHRIMHLPWTSRRGRPAMAWRGAMLDVCRHFLPKVDVLRFIDLMLAHRLNRLHLHLSDDQGWRVESGLYPQLNEIGSWRRQSMLGWYDGQDLAHTRWDGTPHGGFFSAADLREIVAYAQQRAIQVVPEIDLPGHSTPMLASLPGLRVPELAADDDAVGEVTGGWGVFRNVISPLPSSMSIVENLLGEVTDAVASPYLHVGGDECDLTQWRTSAAIADYIHAEGLGGIEDLRRAVNRRLCQLARGLGRRPLVWDEAFVAGGLDADVIVTIWRSRTLAAPVAKAGLDLVLMPSSRAYLDHPESASALEPLSIGGTVPTSAVASWDPLADVPDSARLLGIQGQLWSEYLPTRSDLEYAAFPRLALLSDIAWRGTPVDAEAELPGITAKLTALGVNFRPPAGPHPWQQGGTGDRAAADTHQQLQDPPLAAVWHAESVGH